MISIKKSTNKSVNKKTLIFKKKYKDKYINVDVRE